MNVNITGPRILAEFSFFGLCDVTITQTTLTSLLVLAAVTILCWRLGRNLRKRPGRMQAVTERAVLAVYKLVDDTMGKHNERFAPYIGALFCSSVLGLARQPDRLPAQLDGRPQHNAHLGPHDDRSRLVQQHQEQRLLRLAEGLHGARGRYDADEHHQRDRTADLHVVPSLRQYCRRLRAHGPYLRRSVRAELVRARLDPE